MYIHVCRLGFGYVCTQGTNRSANAARTSESIPPENKTATRVWPQLSVVLQSTDSGTTVCNTVAN